MYLQREPKNTPGGQSLFCPPPLDFGKRTDPKLDRSAFRAAGGKMVVLQSWADPYNAQTWPQKHLRQIEAAMGADAGAWLRLFMVPGGGHCGAAAHYPQVPANWHAVEGLVPWVEAGVAPAALRSTDPPDGSGRSRKVSKPPSGFLRVSPLAPPNIRAGNDLLTRDDGSCAPGRRRPGTAAAMPTTGGRTSVRRRGSHQRTACTRTVAGNGKGRWQGQQLL